MDDVSSLIDDHAKPSKMRRKREPLHPSNPFNPRVASSDGRSVDVQK
jgi:hypothetical protein